VSWKVQTRTARKPHRCGGCDRRIDPGERYLRHVTFPSDGIYDRIQTGAECSDCAAQSGRAIA
jgi:hypothetical protein